VVEVDIAPFDISEVAKTLTKRGVVGPFFFGTSGMPKDPNLGDPAFLRVRKPWQRTYGAADEWQEIAPFHWAAARDNPREG
jgi:hypothetical protein